MTICIIVAILAYAIGSISFSVILSRKFSGFDVREKGSGNAGATNMLRSVGKKAAILTLLCDILKGIIAICIPLIIGIFNKEANVSLLVQIAGIAVIVGHTFPIFFEFRGGKGIATALGVILVTNWQIGLICLLFALILIVITRIVSVGSIMAAILFPVLVLFINTNYVVEGYYFIYSLIVALIILFNHRQNIKRLLNGKENKLSLYKNK